MFINDNKRSDNLISNYLSMMQQLTLDIQYKEQYLLKDFIISSYNKNIIKELLLKDQKHNTQYQNFILLVGRPRSGKTHIAHLWKKIMNAAFVRNIHEIHSHAKFINAHHNCIVPSYIIDDIDTIDPKQIFHMFNVINDENYKCLLTSTKYPINTELMDLNSRINAVNISKLAIPDHEMVRIFLHRNFKTRCIHISEAAINYLSAQITYDLKAIIQIIDNVDRISLKTQQKITIPVIKRYLSEVMS